MRPHSRYRRFLQRYKAAVQAFVAQSKPDTKVRVAISNDDPQSLTFCLRPTSPAHYLQVEVSGNEAVDTGSIFVL